MIAVAVDLDAFEQRAGADQIEHAIALADRQQDRIEHAVDALDQPGEIALEARGVAALAQSARGRGKDQPLDLGDDRAQIGAQQFDRVVDERLLAGKGVERRVEMALTELVDTGHRLLLHRDMAGDHRVDPRRHGREVAAEGVDRHEHVDVALVVLGRHPVHLGDQPLEVAAQPLDRVVEERLLAGEGFERRLEIAVGERGDTGHRLLLGGHMAGDHVIDVLRGDAQVADELCGGQHDVDIAALMLGRHGRDGVPEGPDRRRRRIEHRVDLVQQVAHPAARGRRIAAFGQATFGEGAAQPAHFRDRDLDMGQVLQR